MVPYTYLITFLKTGQCYYGVRFSKTCHPAELGKTYFSSSKLINSLIKENGLESFTFEVRKIFDNIEKAQKWESKVLTRINAAHSEKWFNKHNNIGPFYARGKHTEDAKRKMSESHLRMSKETKRKISEGVKKAHQEGRAYSGKGLPSPNRGRKHTTIAIENMKNGRQGYIMTEEHKRKVSLGGMGKKLSQEHKDKISTGSKGRIFSEEHKQKLSLAAKNRKKDVKNENN